MSGFWDNNKDSIKSGLVSAGKYSYQGTKFVAKTGYSASKKHFNESKKKRDSKDKKKKKKKKKHGKSSDTESEYETDSDYEPGPSRSLESFQNPSAFPPPPLKAGQMQYGSGGTVVTGDGFSPSVTMPNQQGYQPQMQQGYQPQMQQGYQPQMQQGYQPQMQQGYQPQMQVPMQREAMQLPAQQQGYQQQQPVQQPAQQQTYQQPMQQQFIQQQSIQQQVYQQPTLQQGYQQGYQQSAQQEVYQQPTQPPLQMQPQQILPVPGQQTQLTQRQAMQLPGEQQVQQPFGQQPEQQFQPQILPEQLTPRQSMPDPQQLPPRQLPGLPTGNRPAMSLPNTGQSTPQSGYMTPASNNPSMTNIQQVSTVPMTSVHAQNIETSEPEDLTPGPHYEVTPFDQATYEENKDKKMIEIKQADISTFAPPPSHKDRGANIRPRRTLNTSSSTNSLPTSNRNIAAMKNSVETAAQNRSTPTIPDNKSETSTPETGSIEVQSQDKKSNEPPKAAVLGTYQEPTTSFAPPPKPRGIPQPVRNSPASARSGPGKTIPTNTTSLPARPSLPNRSTGSSIEPTQPAVETASQTSETSSVATNDKESEEQKAPILGTYVEKPIEFAPPPKPFRHVETNQHKQTGEPAPVTSPPQTSISSGPPPPVRTSLPSRESSAASVTSDPKPKPQVVSTPNSGNMRDVSSFLPPPKPFRRTESAQEETPSPGVDENKSFIPKKKAPPPVKPKKPNMLNSNSFSRVSSTPSNSSTPLSKRSTAPTLGKKNPPPVVKPKPKSLSRTNTSPMNDITNELNSIHLRHAHQGPPIPASRHHSEPSIPDAAVTTNTNTQNDVNPFAIYKKDAVPLDEDRIHNRR